MPSNPLENMPAALAKHTFSADKFFENFIEFKLNGRVKDQKLEGYMKFSPHENLANLDRPSHVSPSTYPISNLLKQVKVISFAYINNYRLVRLKLNTSYGGMHTTFYSRGDIFMT